MHNATPSLGLPYLQSSQMQKHVTLNESLQVLDAIVQLSVSSASTSLQNAPVEGARQIVPLGELGEGAGYDGDVAVFVDGMWQFHSPRTGWRAWVEDSNREVIFDGLDWVEPPVSARTDRLGINANADQVNRLSVSAPATLLNHAGTDHRLNINRASTSDTASVVFQSGFSGRAEFGLTGDDAFRLKVSSDGSSWTDSLVVDPNTGRLSFPAGVANPAPNENLLLNGDFKLNTRGFAGGVLAANTYGLDRWRGGPSGCELTLNATGIDLVSGTIEQATDLALKGGETVTLSFESADASALSVSCFGQAGAVSFVNGRFYAVFTVPAAPPELTVIAFSGAGDVARVKLEQGDWPTPWRERPAALERAACSAYYERLSNPSVTHIPFANGAMVASTQFSAFLRHEAKRRVPDVSISGDFQLLGLGIDQNDIVSINAFSQTDSGFEMRVVISETRAAGTAGLVRSENDPNAAIEIDAEIYGS